MVQHANPISQSFKCDLISHTDNYSDLCKKRQEFINGEDIWQEATKRKTKPNSKWKDVEEDHAVPPKKVGMTPVNCKLHFLTV